MKSVGRLQSGRVLFWAAGSGFPESNQQVTVASPGRASEGPGCRVLRGQSTAGWVGARGPWARVPGAGGGAAWTAAGASERAAQRRCRLGPGGQCLSAGTGSASPESPQPPESSPPPGSGLRAAARAL